MERILVAFDSLQPTLDAGLHGVNLAKRISAKLFFLWVTSPNSKAMTTVQREARAMMKRRLESLIDQGRGDGVLVDYFVTEGVFETEVIRFVKENKISLLLVGSAANSEDGAAVSGFAETLENIRLRVNCHIEVVHKKWPDAGAERK